MGSSGAPSRRPTAKARYREHFNRRTGNGATSALADVLDDVVSATATFQDVVPLIGQVWADRQNQIFETGSYGRWPALRADTILRKRHEGIGTKTLIDSRALRGQVTNPVPRAQGGSFVVFGPHDASKIDYAKHHMRGDGVPQRNPVPRLTNRERETFMEILRDHYRPEGMKKAVTPSGATWKFSP